MSYWLIINIHDSNMPAYITKKIKIKKNKWRKERENMPAYQTNYIYIIVLCVLSYLHMIISLIDYKNT